MYRNRGFTVPIVVLLTLLFLLLPVIFLYTFNSSPESSVKGASAKTPSNSLSVKITSPNGSWDLQQYLCKDKKDCQSELLSGKRTSTVSGGKTSGQFVLVNQPDKVEDYKYLKIFVQSSWGSKTSAFKLINANVLTTMSAEKVGLKENNVNYDVVLIPLSVFSTSDTYQESIEFQEN